MINKSLNNNRSMNTAQVLFHKSESDNNGKQWVLNVELSSCRPGLRPGSSLVLVIIFYLFLSLYRSANDEIHSKLSIQFTKDSTNPTD